MSITQNDEAGEQKRSNGACIHYRRRIQGAAPRGATENAGLENARPKNAGQNIFYFLPLSCVYCTGFNYC